MSSVVLIFAALALFQRTLASGPAFCGVCANGGLPPMINTHLDLICEAPTATMDHFVFASYGTPSGACPAFGLGSCNAADTLQVVETLCAGQHSCRVFPNLTTFGDPCFGTPKILAVVATCSDGSGTSVCGTSPPPLSEPYAPLNGLGTDGPSQPLSPDPLQPRRWLPGTNLSALQLYYLAPVAVVTEGAAGVFTNTSSLLTNASAATVAVAPALVGPGGAALVVDFGVESAAWLELQSPDLVLANVPGLQFAISEYNEPGFYNTGPKIAAPVQYDGGWFRLELNTELYEGVRFGFILLTDAGGANFTITQIRVACQVKPQGYYGYFQSDNDDLLTKIWWTAAYTVKLNLLADTFGSILIDRGDRISWTGDAHTSQACALVAFANFDLIKSNIDRTSCGSCSNGIESYALYWILSVIDYVAYVDAAAGTAALQQYQANVDGRLMHAADIAFKSPNLNFMGSDDRLGADFEWPSADEPQRVYAMLAIQCLRQWAATIAACSACDKSAVPTYVALAANLTAFARQPSAAGPWHAAYGLHAVTQAVLAGVVLPSEWALLYGRELSSPIEICSFSPFNMYFVLLGLQGMNQTGAAMDAVRRCWGGVISLGGTTFWETFSQEWRRFLSPSDPIPNGQTGYTSMCHPWAAGVVKFLTEFYVGVRPAQAGFATFWWHPHEWGLRGTVMTPLGAIHVQTFRNSTHGTAVVDVPPGALLTAWSLPAEPFTETDGVDLPLSGGRHTRIVALSSPVSTQLEPFVPLPLTALYPVPFVGRDNATQGNWQGVYGRDGFHMFSFGVVGQTLVKLPSYISSCGLAAVENLSLREFVALPTGTTDVRALQAPSGDASGRALGCHATSDPAACLQTFVLDIAFDPTPAAPAYNLSFYVVDTDRAAVRQVIEVRDAVKFELVAPTQLMSDFGDGAYFTYAVNISVRVRVNQLRNGDAVLSAIFFN